MKIRSGFRSSIKSEISERERERKKIEKKGERKGKRKTKEKSGRGVTMKKKKKNKADDSRQLWSISIFNVDDSFCPRNWKFGLRPPLCRASFDRRGLIRPEIREGRPFVRGPRSLFRQVARNRRGEGEGRTRRRKKRRSLARWLPMKSRNRLRGSTLTGTREKKKKYRTFEISRKKWWKRTVWLLSDLYYLYFALFVSWFFRFSFFPLKSIFVVER